MPNTTTHPILSRRALRVSEVKTHYGFGKTRLYKLMKEGKLHTVKVGGLRLIPVESLEALLLVDRA
jgi:excisionase family DNA binding protein